MESQKLLTDTVESVHDIFNKYDTDKNSYFHNYSRQYETLFSKYRNKCINYLEIGVLHGESLKAMRDVFLMARNIVGIDINPGCKCYETSDTHIEIGNSSNPVFLKSVVEKYGPFDIILDDGSHVNRDVFQTFEILFPSMSNGGLYIVEDTICYKVPGFLDGNYPDHLSYFFKFTKFLNQWRHDSSEEPKDNCVDPYKITKKSNDIFECSIDKIEYGCSFIAIHKENRNHWMI